VRGLPGQLGGSGDRAHTRAPHSRPAGNHAGTVRLTGTEERRAAMSKRGRKRRSRKGSKANHGKRPNA
jgi:hypothetical protein